MAEASFTFRVDDGLKNAFASAAKAQDRTGAQLLRDFMRDYVRREQEAADYDAWFRRQVEEGLVDVEAGRVVPHEQVTAEARQIVEEARKRLSRA